MAERKRFVLVYQAGIANVFEVSRFDWVGLTRHAKRVYQGDFRSAESIAYGCGLAGAAVRTAACNMAGDIAGQPWALDLAAQPFEKEFRPVIAV